MDIKNSHGLSDDEVLLTVKEASEVLRLTVGTLYTYRCRGNRGPRYVKLGGKVLYRLSDIREYIASGGVPQIGGAE